MIKSISYRIGDSRNWKEFNISQRDTDKSIYARIVEYDGTERSVYLEQGDVVRLSQVMIKLQNNEI